MADFTSTSTTVAAREYHQEVPTWHKVVPSMDGGTSGRRTKPERNPDPPRPTGPAGKGPTRPKGT